MSITDDDAPSVTISFDSATYSATEGGDDAEVTVRLSSPAPRQVDIPLTAEGLYKATPDDWSGVPAALTFSTGDTSQSFTVVAFDDTVEDNGEMVELRFGALPDGFTAGSPATATITLLNDDEPNPVDVTTEPDGLADYATLCLDTRATLTVGVAFSGTLGTLMDIDAIKVALTAGTMGYKVVLLDHNDLEMSAEHYTFGMVHPDGMYVNYPYLTNWVNERDNLIIIPEETGTYCVEIRDRFSDGPYMQDYKILVSELNPLANPATGPESASPGGDAVEGIPTNPDHFHRIRVGSENAIAGELSDQDDRDWYIAQLENGLYRVTVEGDGTGKGALAFPGLLHWESDAREFNQEVSDYPYSESGWLLKEFLIEESTSGSDIFHFEVWSAGGYTGTYTITLEKIEQFSDPQSQEQSDGEGSRNMPATGGPGISGTPAVGETITATTSRISDGDGLSNAVFAYQWIRQDPTDQTDADIPGETARTYTVTSDDEAKGLRVRVTFTDDAGNRESLTSNAFLFLTAPPVQDTSGASDEPAANSPATGPPTITGTARVGETLTADASDIEDPDGLSNAVFAYQWIRQDPTDQTDADIPGETARTYTVTADDEAKGLRVRVTFTDDAGNRESLTSNAFLTAPPVLDTSGASDEPAANSPATGPPTITGTARVGETLTADASDIEDPDGLSNAVFAYQWIRHDLADQTDADIPGETAQTYTVTSDDEAKGLKVRVTFTDDAGNPEALTSNAFLTAPPVQGPAGASDEPAANSPATGPPTITGTARVGETLTADASDIEDPDGMDDAAFTFRWASGGNDIAGATAASYTLTADEEGLAITVRVSFTDDAGNPEALTSAATEAVATPPPLTAEFLGAPASHDGQTAFTFELRFSEEFSISYKTLRDHAFTVTGGSVTKARRLEPPGNVRWEITVTPDSDAPVTVELPPTTDCDNQGAVCTEDGRRLSNSLELVVSGPGQ